MAQRWFCIAVLAGSIVAACPVAVRAYVRMRTADGIALEWRTGCPMFTIAATGADPVPTADLIDALEAARAAWRDAGRGCPSLPVEIVDSRDGAAGIEYDGESVVLVRGADHCADPAHATDEVCLSPNAAAVTTVFFHERGERAGEIVEADVEINGAFAFATDTSADRIDLVATVTHELGHALALEHTCETIPGRAPLIDSAGAVVQPCFPLDGVSSLARDATMFPFLSEGQIDARTPTLDELTAMCDLYGAHPGTCQNVDPGCGCQGPSSASTLTALVMVLLLWRARLTGRGRRR